MAVAWTPNLQSVEWQQDRWLRHRGCWRKVAFRNHRLAVSRARAHSHQTGELIHAYLCPFDPNHWHIGHA